MILRAVIGMNLERDAGKESWDEELIV